MYPHDVFGNKETSRGYGDGNRAILKTMLIVTAMFVVAIFLQQYIGFAAYILVTLATAVVISIRVSRNPLYRTVEDSNASVWEITDESVTVIDDIGLHIYEFYDGNSAIYIEVRNGYTLKEKVSANRSFVDFIYKSALGEGMAVQQNVTYENTRDNNDLQRVYDNIANCESEKFKNQMKEMVSYIVDDMEENSRILTNMFIIKTMHQTQSINMESLYRKILNYFEDTPTGFRVIRSLTPKQLKSYGKDYFNLKVLDTTYFEVGTVKMPNLKVYRYRAKDGEIVVVNELKKAGSVRVNNRVAKKKVETNEEIEVSTSIWDREEEIIFEEVQK